MLLAIDVGNTNVTIGLWDGVAWIEQWRLRTIHDQTVDEYWVHLRMLLGENLVAQISQVILSSVVPPLTYTYTQLTERYLKKELLRVTADTDTGIIVDTDNPLEVGADRIVNAAAAAKLYGGPAIVIDMGTATTFDWITADHRLTGVVIAPGMMLAAEALTNRAAQLNHVDLKAPEKVLGKNTITAVQSGIVYGYTSLIEGMVKRLKEEHGQDATVIGTGGVFRLIEPHTNVIDYIDPWLTLSGLRIIAERNSSST